MALSTDDDVIMDKDAEGLAGIDDLARHGDIGR